MQERVQIREQVRALGLWTISVSFAVLVFYGTTVFMNSHVPATTRPAVRAVTHSTPIGGKVEDGVYRSSPPEAADVDISRWRI
jgi:hypothetical protein